MALTQDSQTQYHHFIPQFILKNFSHKHAPVRNPRAASGRKKKKNKKTKLYPGDPALYIVDLTGEVPRLTESPVKRTFGLIDMYRDVSNSADHQYLEKEIGKLEYRVSSLIADIRKASESGKTGFSMSRPQRDMLRKFLFIMKFRGPGYHRRFHGDESGNYKQDDTDQFMAYMHENGFQNPVDVWFKCIKAVLDLELDVQGKWKQKLLNSIYPEDAMGFIIHVEVYFLTFCTPSDPSDEFILTENCYNVHEGPNSSVLNLKTGEYEVVAYTPYHEFSPITPRLMLILRSSLLPNAEEDADANIRSSRKDLNDRVRGFHTDPATAVSTFEDFPLSKPRNSYSQRLPQGIQLLPGEDGSRRSNHQFTFPFFKLSPNQMARINCVLLEHAHFTSAIGYNSGLSLKRSLEYYLQLPTTSGYKLIYPQESRVRLAYLKKLESITKSLGSTVTAVYEEAPELEDLEERRQEVDRQLRKDLLKYLPEKPSEFMLLYNSLGGSHDTLIMDMEQVFKMRFLRIKIDVCTKRFREATRESVRNNLRDLFCQLPARRVWLYLKTLREMSLESPGTMKEKCIPDEFMDGPEDVIAKANHVVRPECLGLLLHFTVMQDIEHRRHPGLNPSSNYELDETGIERLYQISRLTFAPVGSIRDCGIKCIQESATGVAHMLRLTKVYAPHMNPVWSVEENIEILVRGYVRGEMNSMLSKHLSEALVEELSDVLFNIVYPTYAKDGND